MSLAKRKQVRSKTEIFADASINEQFYIAVELLAKLVMSMPDSISITELARCTGKRPALVRSIIHILNQYQLVASDAGKDGWHCCHWQDTMTLADVYYCFCMVEEGTCADRQGLAEAEKPDTRQHAARRKLDITGNNLDLLMMQVKITINSAVAQQLAQFDLGRLRGLASSPSFRRNHGWPRDYIPEPC